MYSGGTGRGLRFDLAGRGASAFLPVAAGGLASYLKGRK